MAKSRTPSTKLETELHELSVVLRAPTSSEAGAKLRASLRHGHAALVERAAQCIAELGLEGYEADLRAAFERLLVDGVKRDPGCRGKRAALEALDRLESTDPEPFARACRYTQREPRWGGTDDTAGPLRGRAIAALSRFRYDSFGLLAAELLADPEEPTRLAAIEALASQRDPANAPVLWLKFHTRETSPDVTLACMTALLSLVPEHAVQRIAAMLSDKDPAVCELAAIALGQSARDDALDALLTAARACDLANDRVHLWRAVGLHRSDRALRALLEVLAEGGVTDARAAVAALAHRAREPGLAQKVGDAAARNVGVDLRAALQEAFGMA